MTTFKNNQLITLRDDNFELVFEITNIERDKKLQCANREINLGDRAKVKLVSINTNFNGSRNSMNVLDTFLKRWYDYGAHNSHGIYNDGETEFINVHDTDKFINPWSLIAPNDAPVFSLEGLL